MFCTCFTIIVIKRDTTRQNNMKTFKCVLILLCIGYATTSNSFTNFVNMEKLYTLEDELITISDVILKQEKVLHGDDNIHGIYNISR